jgi:hypothetical protein
MNWHHAIALSIGAAGLIGASNAASPEGDHRSSLTIQLPDPARLPRLTTVDPRFQSYNVEMLEVTGGAFWKPYADAAPTVGTAQSGHAGIDASAYQYRPPIDLTNKRLVMLARALGPAYLRVSGSWANSVYFADGEAAPAQPPAGFKSVLTPKQWRGVIDFARSVDARIVTSFAISSGVRDADGAWTDDQARRWLTYTRAIGGNIAAAEFMNEPSMAGMGGAPKGYDAAAYGRDFRRFRQFAATQAPGMILLGPGSATETPAPWGMPPHIPGSISTAALMAAAGPGIDAFSYHHYGAASQRCASARLPQTSLDQALSEEWLARTSATHDFYAALRDAYAPGKPIWMTEGAGAACGGNPWGGHFVDSFRYLDQLGRLAKAGVKVVIHNTLAASNYALLEPADFTPKANYWAALLWHRLMGATVLDAGVPLHEGAHVYAHCQAGRPGGVTLLIINNSVDADTRLTLPIAGRRYTLSAPVGSSSSARLNGTLLRLGAGDRLPAMKGVAQPAGRAIFPARSISFVTLDGADNTACR